VTTLFFRCTSSIGGSPAIVVLSGHHCSQQRPKNRFPLCLPTRRCGSQSQESEVGAQSALRIPERVLFAFDAMSPPRTPDSFQADGPKSPVVADSSQSPLSHRSAVQGQRGGPESRFRCRVMWRIGRGEFSVRSKTRDWGAGPSCRERVLGR
jgi:hypothetical protein